MYTMKKYRFLLIALCLVSIGGFRYVSAHGFAESLQHVPVCPGPAASESARCHARVVVDHGGKPEVTTAPSGYGPAQFHAAYAGATTATTKQIIAIVDAYDDPNIFSDLNTYSTQFGIPTMKNCTVASATLSSPCFQKVNQRGGTSMPKADAGWSLEIALDVETAHAMCQNCSVLLVEADSNSYANLMAAVDRAAAMGATVISNSYGSSEFSGETSYDSHLNHPGVAITVSSGDSGYGAEYPAASRYVTAVGGTKLLLNTDGTYDSESAWTGAGSGCSTYESKPSWQHDATCAKRTIADVSADADPSTGAAVYDSVHYQGKAGWFRVGGTSLASPLIAGVYALAGNSASTTYPSSMPYGALVASYLHDILSGSNGSCGISYLCTASSDYDGPTGLGTPKGLGAF